ncbi:type II toxin-antitoxin system Phd/YefM family antitoxin [Ilumatobacter sp.]|uniref:type II toxin-antitoxin system Phd/YefM family antitoxin n=1 Tax=Ilumatobacter sp. TaxID=1967498 RepID=UPI003C4016B9
MDSVGLRELRQAASELIRRVEGGEEIDITVAGRLAARMVPVMPKRWQSWDAIAELFHGPPDPSWPSDQDLIDQSISNPWDDA